MGGASNPPLRDRRRGCLGIGRLHVEKDGRTTLRAGLQSIRPVLQGCQARRRRSIGHRLCIRQHRHRGNQARWHRRKRRRLCIFLNRLRGGERTVSLRPVPPHLCASRSGRADRSVREGISSAGPLHGRPAGYCHCTAELSFTQFSRAKRRASQTRSMRRTSKHSVVASALLLGFSLNALADEVPVYEARPVAAPIDAVSVAGSDGFEEMLAKFNQLFTKTHPGFKFKVLVGGLPSISLYGLITGTSAFALIDREIWPLETRPFRQIYGYEPTAIRIGRAGHSGPGRMNPPGVYVNAKNPLAGLTVDQVARVFTTGGGNGDMTHWGQLGLKGAWTQRVIHLYGPPDDGRLASALRHFKMDGFPFARRYEPLSTPAEIIHAVAM